MPASSFWTWRRSMPQPAELQQAAKRPALWILWTSPSDRPAPRGTRGQPVDSAAALVNHGRCFHGARRVIALFLLLCLPRRQLTRAAPP